MQEHSSVVGTGHLGRVGYVASRSIVQFLLAAPN